MSSDLRAAVVLQGSGVLQSLPSSLPDAALASRVPSTYAKLFSSYNSWRFWAREHGLTVFPASPFHVAIYLCHLMTEAKTASPLESAVHSISWFNQFGGLSVIAVSCLQAGLDGFFVRHSFGCYLLASFCCLSQI